MTSSEKDIIKQCGGFCQVCLEYPGPTNEISLVYLDGNAKNTSSNNTRVMCQTCQAKREGRPYPGATKKKVRQLSLFEV